MSSAQPDTTPPPASPPLLRIPLALHRTYQYQRIYHSLTLPLDLYHESPPLYAPVTSPRGRTRWSPVMRDYAQLVHRHEAYIGPRDGDTIGAVVARLLAAVSRGDALGAGEQRKSSPRPSLLELRLT